MRAFRNAVLAFFVASAAIVSMFALGGAPTP